MACGGTPRPDFIDAPPCPLPLSTWAQAWHSRPWPGATSACSPLAWPRSRWTLSRWSACCAVQRCCTAPRTPTWARCPSHWPRPCWRPGHGRAGALDVPPFASALEPRGTTPPRGMAARGRAVEAAHGAAQRLGRDLVACGAGQRDARRHHALGAMVWRQWLVCLGVAVYPARAVRGRHGGGRSGVDGKALAGAQTPWHRCIAHTALKTQNAIFFIAASALFQSASGPFD